MRVLPSLQATVKTKCPSSAQRSPRQTVRAGQAGYECRGNEWLSPHLSLGKAGALAPTHPTLGTDGPMGLLPAGHRFFQFMLC